MTMRPHPTSLVCLLLAFGFALCGGFPAVVRAQTAAPAAPREISEKLSPELGKLRVLVDAKDHVGALRAIGPLLAAAAPESYDRFVLGQVQLQLLLTENKFSDAIQPLERTLALGERQRFYVDDAARAEQHHLLAQLYQQRATEAPASAAAARRADQERALAAAIRGIEIAPRPDAERLLFAATVAHTLGTLDPAAPDKARLREAIAHAEAGLRLAPAPGAPLRLVLIASYQQIGDEIRAAEHLEILAASEPAGSATWAQLLSLYLSEAERAADPAEARRANLRALLTLERAQARGQLVSPREHYTRAALLFNLGQHTRAAERLEQGLADGSLENQKRAWELLAAAYQQTDQVARAADALVRAVADHPGDAGLEFSLAQLDYSRGEVERAYARGRSAHTKSAEPKPGQLTLFLAYLAFELARFDEARVWLEAARARPDVNPASVEPLGRAIEEALRERAARAAARAST